MGWGCRGRLCRLARGRRRCGLGACGVQCFGVAQQKPRPICRCRGVERVGRGCAANTQHCNREPGFFVLAIEKLFSFRPDWHQDERASPLVRQYRTTLESVLESHPQLRECLKHCTHCGIEFLTDPRNASRTNLRCPFGCRQCHRRQCSSRRSTAYNRTAAGKFKKKRRNAQRASASRRREPTAQSGATIAATPNALPAPSAPISPVTPTTPATSTSPAAADIPTGATTADVPVPPVALPDSPAALAAASAASTSSPGVVPFTRATTDRPADPEFALRVGGVVLDGSSLTESGLLPYVGLLVRLIDRRDLSADELRELLERSLRQRRSLSRSRRSYVLEYLHQHPP